MNKMKISKSIFAGFCTLAACITPIYAQEEYNPNTEYTSDQSIVYNETDDTYYVEDKGLARASYTKKGSVVINGTRIYAYISVDASSGKIVSTSISQPSGNGITARYNVSFNSKKTSAYFTITLYSTVYGSIYHALGTKYITLNSGGSI